MSTPDPTSDLVTWLRGVLDEDEAARAPRTAGEWTPEVHDSACPGDLHTQPGDRCECGRPAFVLADIAAKRAILEFAVRVLAARDEHEANGALFSVPIARARIRDVLRLLASAYRDRPGYRPERAPTTG